MSLKSVPTSGFMNNTVTALFTKPMAKLFPALTGTISVEGKNPLTGWFTKPPAWCIPGHSLNLPGIIPTEQKNVHWLWMGEQSLKGVPASGTQSSSFVHSAVSLETVPAGGRQSLSFVNSAVTTWFTKPQTEPFLALPGTIPVEQKKSLRLWMGEWSLESVPASSRQSYGFVNCAVRLHTIKTPLYQVWKLGLHLKCV